MNEKIFITCIELNSMNVTNKFEEIIKHWGECKKLMTNVYAIKRPFSETSEDVKNLISSILGEECILFIMKSSIDASWFLDEDVDNWIKTNI